MPTNVSQNLKVALYARVSGEEQREGQTIDSQVAEIERYAAQNNWSVVEVYKDDGWSGSLLARPQLDRLRDAASKGQFNAVLINDVDRLARDVSHLGIVKRDLEKHSVDIIFRKLPSEKSPTHNLMVNILGSFAEFEREMITDRTRRGRRHKVEVRQKYLGALAPYGYRYIRKDRAAGQEGYLEIAPEEAAIVKQIFKWIDEGISASKITLLLNQDSVPTRKGKPWQKSSVSHILRRETYAGVWHYYKNYACEPMRNSENRGYRRSPKSSRRLRPRSEWLPVTLPTHLQIIDRDQWERVQTQVTNNTNFSLRNGKRFYLLKGLMRCGGCAATYIGDTAHGCSYYRCRKYCKKVPGTKGSVLDSLVWLAIEETILNPSIIAEQMARRDSREKEQSDQIANESQEISKALQQLHQEESRILEAYRLNILSPSQLGQELEKLKSRKKSLEVRERYLGESKTKVPTSTLCRTLTDYCQSVSLRIKSFSPEEQQKFLRLLVKGIIVERDQVRIKTVIPLDTAGGPRQISNIAPNAAISVENADNVSLAPGRFASPTTRSCVPNSIEGRTANPKAYLNGHKSEFIASKTKTEYGRHSITSEGLEFELISSIDRTPYVVGRRNTLGRYVRFPTSEAA